MILKNRNLWLVRSAAPGFRVAGANCDNYFDSWHAYCFYKHKAVIMLNLVTMNAQKKPFIGVKLASIKGCAHDIARHH